MAIAAHIHLTAILIWIGIIAVEVVIEKSSIGAENIEKLHRLTDRILEMPIALLVLVSGLVLWSQAGWSIALLPKILVGAGAIAVAVYCYICVEKRDTESGNFSQLTARMDRSAYVGIICFLAALYLGSTHTA